MTDPALLAAIKKYRDAYYAYYAHDMRERRDYERLRHRDDFDEEAWEQRGTDNQEEGRQLYYAMQTAQWALVDSPPPDFAKLVAEMKEEFGD